MTPFPSLAAPVACAAALLLCACGVDTLTAAGTGATAAAQSAKQAQQEKAIADEKIKAMQDAMQQHTRNLDEQADHPGERGER